MAQLEETRAARTVELGPTPLLPDGFLVPASRWTHPSTRMRELLECEPYLFGPGVYDPMGAQLAMYHGSKAVYFSGAYTENPHGVKIQFVREMMRLQKDRGEFEAAKFMLRRLGGTDLSSAELPDIDIPAEMLEVDGIAETMPNVLDMPMAAGVRVR